jgi:hypothetical protein
LTEWTGDDRRALADLGYEGEPGTFTLPIKKPKGGRRSEPQTQLNWLQAHARARAEQANAVLKTTFKALRRVSLEPNMIGQITAAALYGRMMANGSAAGTAHQVHRTIRTALGRGGPPGASRSQSGSPGKAAAPRRCRGSALLGGGSAGDSARCGRPDK